MIRINLNEPIKVKLTKLGKYIYYHKYDRANHIAGIEVCKPSFPKEDEDGYSEFQIWDFMALYGSHIGMALPNVIEPLEMVYQEPERKKGKWTFIERGEPQWDLFGVETWANVYKCSECEFRHAFIENQMCYSFCPICGADMRGEQE